MPKAIQIQSLLGGEKINRKQFLITTFHWISQNSVHRISSPSGHTIRKKKRRLQTIKKNEQKTDTNHSIFFCLHYKLHNPAHHSICVCVCVCVQACVCLISSGFKSLMVQSEMYVTIKQQKNCALHNPHWQNLQIP